MWVIFSGIISIIVLLLYIIPSIAIGLDVRKCILEYRKGKYNRNIRLSTYIFAYCLWLFLTVGVVVDIITDWMG